MKVISFSLKNNMEELFISITWLYFVSVCPLLSVHLMLLRVRVYKTASLPCDRNVGVSSGRNESAEERCCAFQCPLSSSSSLLLSTSLLLSLNYYHHHQHHVISITLSLYCYIIIIVVYPFIIIMTVIMLIVAIIIINFTITIVIIFIIVIITL